MNQQIGFHSSIKCSNFNLKEDLEDIVIFQARELLGSPFKEGGKGPDEFDSGGFIQFVFKNSLGINLPNNISDLLKMGIDVPYEDIQPGDLIFTYIGQHVGIYMGDNKFIHSPYEGEKVKISDIENFYKSRRVLYVK